MDKCDEDTIRSERLVIGSNILSFTICIDSDLGTMRTYFCLDKRIDPSVQRRFTDSRRCYLFLSKRKDEKPTKVSRRLASRGETDFLLRL